MKAIPMGTASWLHIPKPSRCVLSTRSVYKRISMPNRGAKDTARDLMRHQQGDQAEPKCLRCEERPSQHVLLMFPP